MAKKEKAKKKLLAYKIIVLVVVEVGVAVLCVEQEHLRLAKASEGKEGTGGPHCVCKTIGKGCVSLSLFLSRWGMHPS